MQVLGFVKLQLATLSPLIQTPELNLGPSNIANFAELCHSEKDSYFIDRFELKWSKLKSNCSVHSVQYSLCSQRRANKEGLDFRSDDIVMALLGGNITVMEDYILLHNRVRTVHSLFGAVRIPIRNHSSFILSTKKKNDNDVRTGIWDFKLGFVRRCIACLKGLHSVTTS